LNKIIIIEINKLSGNKKKEEEKIGSKIIQWTPFPNPLKNLVDFSKLESASQKMTTFKIFPVYKIFYQIFLSKINKK